MLLATGGELGSDPIAGEGDVAKFPAGRFPQLAAVAGVGFLLLSAPSLPWGLLDPTLGFSAVGAPVLGAVVAPVGAVLGALLLAGVAPLSPVVGVAVPALGLYQLGIVSESLAMAGFDLGGAGRVPGAGVPEGSVGLAPLPLYLRPPGAVGVVKLPLNLLLVLS